MSIHDWVEPITVFMEMVESVLNLPFPYATDYTFGQVFLATTVIIFILGLFFGLGKG